MGLLKTIQGVKPIYFLPRENLAGEVLIPSLALATSVDCMVGYFSGHSFGILAPGLASFISSSDRPIRLIICPVLGHEDRDAITHGYKEAEDVIEEFLKKDISIDDALARHTLQCLSYLIGIKRVVIKVALMKDALFHAKVWVISDGDDTIAVHGSGNLTVAGLSRNFEQVTVSRSWESSSSQYIVKKFQEEFVSMWNKTSNECQIFDFPEAVVKRILIEYNSTNPPTEDALLGLLQADNRQLLGEHVEREPFHIPPYLNYTSGDFAHQGQAAASFCNSGYRGILAMATGSGKTITSMIAAFGLYKREEKLLIVVAAPYIPLITQWCEEIAEFGINPINLSTVSGIAAKNSQIAAIARRIRLSTESVSAVVVTHDTLCDKSFQEALSRVDVPVFLIADEVHNLGRPAFISEPPEHIQFRLGLSATPERQYDQEGTDALVRYFGPIVFSFSMEQAIGNCLVPYDYHVHPTALSEDELTRWQDLTEKIKKEMWRTSSDSADDTILSKLLRDRRLILETAEQKISSLNRLLDQEDLKSLCFTLIYATDKDPRQLDEVNALLRRKRIRFHELTSDQTSDREATRRIIEAFQNRDIQVLTAKRVLDEGVNIPQISKAFILASTTVGRQWVQRRGRLLRKCSAINKTYSVIHDFIVIPPPEASDADVKTLLRGELDRVTEFGRLSRNFASATGALKAIHSIVTKYFS